MHLTAIHRCAGGISKGDLKTFLAWGTELLGCTKLTAIAVASQAFWVAELTAEHPSGAELHLTAVHCCAGGISKGDLKTFLAWAAEHLGYTELTAIAEATPTAELEPLREGTAPQTDEQVEYSCISCLRPGVHSLMRKASASLRLERPPQSQAGPPAKRHCTPD